MSQQQQQLAASTIKEESVATFADVECPDCFAPLGVYYDEHDKRHHYCENCDHEVNPRDVDSDWDVSDNNISTEYTDAFNRRVF